MRLAILVLLALTTLPTQAQASPLRGSLSPHPSSVGRALVRWEVGTGVRQWWLSDCAPSGACRIIATGTAAARGTIEVFTPQAGESWHLQDTDTTVTMGPIPSDWGRRWVLLPEVGNG